MAPNFSGTPLFIGIDPGREGYVCAWDGSSIRLMVAIPYLGDEVDVWSLRRVLRRVVNRGGVMAVIERQHPFHREGPKGAFTNGFGYGVLKASLIWSGLPHEAIAPDVWKREIGLAVPQVSTPALPAKPSMKSKVAAWKKKVEAAKAKGARIKQRARKELACRMAQEFEPDYDFRSGPRARKPHEGKCEAYLLARLARKRHEARA